MTHTTKISSKSIDTLPTKDLCSFRFFPYPQTKMSRPHSHNDIELNFIADGAVTYLFGSRQVILTPGKIYVFWATIPHQLVHSNEATSYFAVHLPLATFLQWQLPTPLTQQVLQGQLVASPNNDDAVLNLALFERWHQNIETDTGEHRKITLLEIEANLRYLALSAQTPTQTVPNQNQPSGTLDSIEKMVVFITSNFQKPLTVSEISETANLHPNYAMQLFRKYTNRTIITYLTQYRIAYAQHLLLTSNKSVLDIAFESGFSSASRFYAAFKDICSVSPTKYRQSLRQRSNLTTTPAHFLPE